MKNRSWNLIIKKYSIDKHDFDKTPFYFKAEDIKKATIGIKETGQREVRILCKQDYRDKRPDFFIKQGLFLLPVKNGEYAIIKGEGYIDIPSIEGEPLLYKSKLQFDLDTAKIGNSEMQHLDFAYATSVLRTFLSDETLVLTIRGRKYTPSFSFRVGKHKLQVKGVQTEVDAGYEGKKQVALVEAKNREVNNVIIRQLFYPFRQWSHHTDKKVVPVFFNKEGDTYSFWQFGFRDSHDYNSIYLVQSNKYII
jgi:hypothetical protein